MKQLDKKSSFFVLRGFASILIGIYIIAGAYGIKYVVDSALINDDNLKDASVNNNELLILFIVIMVLIATVFTFFVGAKKHTENINFMLWNTNTKKLTLLILLILFAIIVLFSQGFINFITPILLIIYAIFLFSVKNKKRKDFLILSGISLILGVLCFLIPTYWYYSLFILGIAHITYGVVVKD